MKRIVNSFLLLAALVLFASPVLAGEILINNIDSPNQGFNDPTPAAPVGGNPGTTIGQQRLNVFAAAAEIWEDNLNGVTQDIIVQSTFQDRGFTPCTATGAV